MYICAYAYMYTCVCIFVEKRNLLGVYIYIHIYMPDHEYGGHTVLTSMNPADEVS